MNLDGVFNILQEKGVITTKEFGELGFSAYQINNLLNDEMITRVSKGIYSGNINGLAGYAKSLSSKKMNDEAHRVYEVCYKIAPMDYETNLQLLLWAFKKYRKKELFKHFDVVYNLLLSSDETKCDANYLLVFLSHLIVDMPLEYKERLSQINEDDILKNNEGNNLDITLENDIRNKVFYNDFIHAYHEVIARNSMNNSYSSWNKLEERLCRNAAYKEKQNINAIINRIKCGKYKDIVNMLDSEKKQGGLSFYNDILLDMVNDYLDISETGVVPHHGENENPWNIYHLLIDKDYKCAYEFLKKYEEEHEDFEVPIEFQGIYLMLEELYHCISKIEEKQETEESRELNPVDSLQEDSVSEPFEDDSFGVNDTDMIPYHEINYVKEEALKALSGDIISILKPMSRKQMGHVYTIIKDISNIVAFEIEDGATTRIVLRKKIKKPNYISLRELLLDANGCFEAKNYEDAMLLYKMLLSFGDPNGFIYSGYAMCLIKQGSLDRAIPFLMVSSELNRQNNVDINYYDLIESLKNRKPDRRPTSSAENEQKPRFEFGESEFLEKSIALEFDFIDDLIALTRDGEINLVDAMEKLKLSEIEKNIVRLIYARDCYYLGLYEEGDSYLRVVEKSKFKDSKINNLLSEIREKRKFYINRLDEDRKCLILK